MKFVYKKMLMGATNGHTYTFFFRYASGKNIEWLLNYQFSQKFKLLGNGEVNHLNIILTLSFTYWPRPSLNKWAPKNGIFNFYIGR